MKEKLPEKLLKVFGEIAQSIGASGFHVNQPIICDHCRDERKEAFPYGVYDAVGKFWNDLCNDCFDELGCRYDWMDVDNADDKEAERVICPTCGANIPNDGICWYCENNPILD